MDDELQHSSRQSAKRPPATRHGKLPRRNSWSTPLKFVLATIAVFAISGVSVAAYAAWDLASTAKEGVTLANEEILGDIPSIGAIDGGVNMLIVGTDKRPADGSFGDPEEESAVLNDVNMLIHISQDHTSATVVSFPRDLFVSIPECTDAEGNVSSAMSSQKINNTYYYGGLACTVATVEKLTGLSIPFAAEIEFYGVIALSDAIGGVEVCVAEEIQDEYTGTFLSPGMHTLQGLSALQFLRTRHGVGDGSDITRISNQQVYLSALARKLTGEGILDNAGTLFALAKASLSNMTFSNSLRDPARLVSIALALKGIPLDRITFVQHPNGYIAGGGGVTTERAGADALYAALAADVPIALSGDSGGGAIVDQAATEAAKQQAAAATPVPSTTPGATTAPSAAPTEAPAPEVPVTVLPGTVKGTTAGTVTCSNGRTLDDQ